MTTPPTALAYSNAHGGCLAIGSSDGNLCLFHPRNNSMQTHNPGHSGWISAVAWNVGGTALLTASDEGALRVWNRRLDAASCPTRLPLPQVRGAALGHAPASLAISCSPNDFVVVKNDETRSVAVSDTVSSFCYDQSEDQLLLGTASGQIVSSYPVSGDSLPLLKALSNSLDLMLWNSSRTDLLAVGHDGEGVIIKWGAFERIQLPLGLGAITSACWLESGALVAGMDDGSVVVLHRRAEGLSVDRVLGHRYPIANITEVPSGVITRDIGGEVRLWQISLRECIGRFSHTQSLRPFSLYLPARNQVATMTSNGSIAILSAQSLTLIQTFDLPLNGWTIVSAQVGDPQFLEDSAYFRVVTVPV
jgi:WD40 repeat protein